MHAKPRGISKKKVVPKCGKGMHYGKNLGGCERSNCLKRTEICSNCEHRSKHEFGSGGGIGVRICPICHIAEEIDMNDSSIDGSDVDIGAPSNVEHVYADGVETF